MDDNKLIISTNQIYEFGIICYNKPKTIIIKFYY